MSVMKVTTPEQQQSADRKGDIELMVDMGIPLSRVEVEIASMNTTEEEKLHLSHWAWAWEMSRPLALKLEEAS